MRYVVLGGSGYIGSEFVAQIGSASNEVIGCSSEIVDCCDYLQLRSLLEDIKPDFVVNAAGYVGKPNVDACEKNKEATLIGNVTLPLNVASLFFSHASTFGLPT
jgi:dTDP-4-dehydrorhamnose reductase